MNHIDVMMKRILFVIALTIFGAGTSFSQQFMHGAGIGMWVNFGSGIKKTGMPVITYAPRLNLFKRHNSSVSVSVPVNAGAAENSIIYFRPNGQEVTSVWVYALSIAAMANINFGAGSEKANNHRVGYYGGAGVSYLHGSYISSAYDKTLKAYPRFKATAMGPAANLGMRFAVGKSVKRTIEAKLFAAHSFRREKISSISFSSLYNF